MQSTRRFGVLVIVLSLMGLAAGGRQAAAASPIPVSGSYVYTSSGFESFRFAGVNAIIGLEATVEYTGSFTGTSIVRGMLIAHAGGRATFHDVEVFTGSLNGVPGTVTFMLSGFNDEELDVRARSTIVHATGALEGLRGRLRLRGGVQVPEGPFGTYSGQVVG